MLILSNWGAIFRMIKPFLDIFNPHSINAKCLLHLSKTFEVFGKT